MVRESDGSTPDRLDQTAMMLKRRGYSLEKLIGEGSYAKVYSANFQAKNDPGSQRVACKVVDTDLAPKDFLRKFFPREIEIMSRVNHPNLIRIHSIIQRDNKYFLFMQYCENGDLLDFIRNNGAIDEKQARTWFSQIIKGLKYLHELDIAHRDLKCENVLLTSNYNVKLTDFGFARYFTRHMKKSETFCGSVSYAPPEIIRGSPYDPLLSDIWSVGVILFVMVNKGMPFDDAVLKKMYECQLTRSWKFRARVKESLSPEFKIFLYKILDPVPEDRPTFEQMYREPWFLMGDESDRLHYPSFAPLARMDDSRPSVFTSRPSYQEFTTDGVAIMNADTDTVQYSRKVMKPPDEDLISSMSDDE